MFFGRSAENTQMTVLILDGEVAADGLIIGNSDIEAVMLVVNLVDKIIEH